MNWSNYLKLTTISTILIVSPLNTVPAISSSISNELFSYQIADDLPAINDPAGFPESLTAEDDDDEGNNMLDLPLEHLIYLGSFLLLIAVVIAIGIISKKMAEAIIFAAILTAILFAVFFLLII